MTRFTVKHFAGCLRQSGRENVYCTGWAQEIGVPGTSLVEHVRPSIETVSTALEDGDYELHALGRVFRLTRDQGKWAWVAFSARELIARPAP